MVLNNPTCHRISNRLRRIKKVLLRILVLSISLKGYQFVRNYHDGFTRRLSDSVLRRLRLQRVKQFRGEKSRDISVINEVFVNGELRPSSLERKNSSVNNVSDFMSSFFCSCSWV